MSAITPCPHENFNAFVDVGRIQRSDSDPEIIYYSAEIKIACRDCGQPLEFVGVPCGLSSYQPTVSVGGDKLRVPMVIPGREVPAGLSRLRCAVEGSPRWEGGKAMSEKLTDAEVLCAFMEPKPPLNSFNWSGRSALGFWVVNPPFNDQGEPVDEVAPVLSSLGYHKEHLYYLRRLEERLTEEQQWDYCEAMRKQSGGRHQAGTWHYLHATPEQKIKALAPILRPIVEGGAL